MGPLHLISYYHNIRCLGRSPPSSSDRGVAQDNLPITITIFQMNNQRLRSSTCNMEQATRCGRFPKG